MIELCDAEKHMKDLLGNINFQDVTNVWNAFKLFSKVEFAGITDSSLLFQCGVFDFTGTELFYFDFVRQFIVEEDDEYSHMEQLHCEFIYKEIEDLRLIKKVIWSYDTDDNFDLFFNKVEELQEFLQPIQEYVPYELKVFQEII